MLTCMCHQLNATVTACEQSVVCRTIRTVSHISNHRAYRCAYTWLCYICTLFCLQSQKFCASIIIKTAGRGLRRPIHQCLLNGTPQHVACNALVHLRNDLCSMKLIQSDRISSCMWSRLRMWLDSILWEQETPDHQIYRMKGLLQIHGSSCCHVLQAVQELYDIVEGPQWEASTHGHSRVVVIGRHLKADTLHYGFQSCQHPFK